MSKQLSSYDQSVQLQDECAQIVKRMITESIILWGQGKKVQKTVKEVWIGIGIELTDLNGESKKILIADWRDKKQ